MNPLRRVVFLSALAAAVSFPPEGRADVGDCHSGIPCYLQSDYSLTPPTLGCQYRFTRFSGPDQPVFQFHLVDVFGAPMPDWIVELEVVAADGSVACQCAGMPSAVSDAGGNGEIPLGFVGGKGEFDLVVHGTKVGTTEIYEIGYLFGFQFTSVDQNATCDPVEPFSTILDIGVWAQGMPPFPYVRTSDFNCDGTVNVIDFGSIGSGMSRGCTP
ncbi:MAG: hypothetical protein KC591_08005 [Gemmatimonadetes bacterium]|nr:hypothetical protein [Gemmatimonadota bacterium]